MENPRKLKEQWKLTESKWNESKKDIKNVNMSQTKKEKLEEGAIPDKKKKKKIKAKKPLKKPLKKKATEDAASTGGATGTGAIGVPGEVPDSRIGLKNERSAKKKVQTRESFHDTLDRAYKTFVLGDSVVYREEEDEDMGKPDDMPDMDDEMGAMGADEYSDDSDMDDMDDMGPEMGMEPEMDIEPEVPGMGADPIEARLAAIEARLASMEGGSPMGDEMMDLGDELPGDMEDEYAEPDMGMPPMGDMDDLDDINDLGGMEGEYEDDEENL